MKAKKAGMAGVLLLIPAILALYMAFSDGRPDAAGMAPSPGADWPADDGAAAVPGSSAGTMTSPGADRPADDGAAAAPGSSAGTMTSPGANRLADDGAAAVPGSSAGAMPSPGADRLADDGAAAVPGSSAGAMTSPGAAVLPEGYRQVETALFTLAIPRDWSASANGHELVFEQKGETLGETETLGWFDDDRWVRGGLKPNHSELTEFAQATDLSSPLAGQTGFRLYRIRLIHTKPAAQMDPDWSYHETRWYWTDAGRQLSYGVYFNEAAVDDETMRQVVSSIRLK